jgi:hypothetical protein
MCSRSRRSRRERAGGPGRAPAAAGPGATLRLVMRVPGLGRRSLAPAGPAVVGTRARAREHRDPDTRLR